MSARNVLGGPLQCCCTKPMTGYFRDGYCRTDASDVGSHTVCVIMTEDFLIYSLEMGNDLITPMPQWGFPGLGPGDKWCLCASRWWQAYQHGKAPKVVLEASHERALDVCELTALIDYAADERTEIQ
jgi:uncharacterized protein